VDEEVGFLVALAAGPNDLTTHLVYADWLDEHDDPGGTCLRTWVELVQTPYEDANYRHLLGLVEQFQLALNCADRQWVEVVGEARDWVDAALAEKVVRLHLRVRHGRKIDRQWVGRPTRSVLKPLWSVPYWRNDPAAAKGDRTRWSVLRDRSEAQVDRITAMVDEPPKRPTRTAQPEIQPS